MPNPSSNFLRGANNSGSDGSASVPDETAVLMAIGKPRSSTVNITTIASALMTTPTAVGLIVDQLILSGLVEEEDGADGSNFRLSAAGERALRYASLAKF